MSNPKWTALECWLDSMSAGLMGDLPTGPQDSDVRKAMGDPVAEESLRRRIMAGILQARAFELRYWCNKWMVEHGDNPGMMALVRTFLERSHKLEAAAVIYGQNGLPEEEAPKLILMDGGRVQ